MDFTKASIAEPLVLTDRIIYAKSMTLSPSNSVGTTTIDVDVSDSLSANPGLLPFGIYSYDNGTTWQQFTDSSRSVLDTILSVIAGVEFRLTNKIRFQFRVSATVGSGTTIPVLIKIGLIDVPFDMPDFGGIEYIKTIFVNIEADNFEQRAAYDARYTAPRIYKAGTVPQDGTVYTISHNLGVIPDVRPFEYFIPSALITPPVGPTVSHPNSFKVDATNLYIDTIANIANSRFGYIIYYPETT